MRDDTGVTAEPDVPRSTWWLDERLSRLGITGRFARDCLLATVLTVLTFLMLALLFRVVAPAEGLIFDPTWAWLVSAVAGVQTMVLCLRRVRPLLCLALVVGLQLVVTGSSLPDATIRGLAPFVAAYTVGSLLPLRPALLAAGAAVAVDTTGALVATGLAGSSGALVATGLAGTSGALVAGPAGSNLFLTAVGHFTATVLVYFGATFVGGYVATRRRNLELIRQHAEEAIVAQQARVQAAIGAERSRMARELHDVAAHHLSGMIVQASAVQRLIDRDPSAAQAGVAWIRTQGKETLDNLRLVVGVLRGRPGDDGGDGTVPVPVPGLAMLDELVRTADGLAGPVELIRDGEQRDVSPIADVALYRMVQESLSNARQHAPGAPVRVELRFLPREIRLEVVNGPAPRRFGPSAGGSGVGLVGMRERAQLIGARFTAGPTAAGGWSVSVRLPTRDDNRFATTAKEENGE
ncbi:histidine kinase [Micromonospora sp. FIMYZ51]|uniref:sensor histidine kinase n=1 Tax=Micromonospora sp. FIMYZ51 TaxID=3051832 RepID=UPI00311D49D2